jgi:ATP-dependent DNA helicase RecG
MSPLCDSNSPLWIDAVAVESSAIARVAYDPPHTSLYLEFHDGAICQYSNVPLAVYRDFIRAESKGTYFNGQIRPHYPFRRVRALNRLSPD